MLVRLRHTLLGSELLAAGEDSATALETGWFLRLRWWVAAALAVALLTARFLLELSPPLLGGFGVIAAAVISNLAAARWAKEWPPFRLRGVLLVADTTLLTIMLQLTGGPSNPFSLVYLVHVTLAAALIDARWTWIIAGYSITAYGALFFFAEGSGDHHHMSGEEYATHLRAMWLALALAAIFAAYFATRLSSALRAHAARSAELGKREAAARRMMSMMTFAAGAAHELGTPLGTIGLVASELERVFAERQRMAASPHAASELEDVQLIGREVARCRRILDRMRPELAESPPREHDAEALLRDALPAPRPGVTLELTSAGPKRIRAQAVAVQQVVGIVVANALDAARGRVRVHVEVEPSTLVITVRDDGPGMDPAMLARLGEPFFTTKGPGRGIGLGLFVAKTIVSTLDGALTHESAEGQGTTATVRLRIEVIA
ncbi:MAG: HAMP domain-containing histidine kinase [Deltaproteobacteria bacterium]|nr:HAMP domain-containing histidine kinase [Deltaproteobacteria bacterium]